MISQLITACLIMSFFNIGVIGGLQRVMHAVDMDLGNQHLYPWRREFVYVGYEVVIAGLLLWMSHAATGMTQVALLNVQLVVVLGFTHTLKTLPAILTTVVANFALFAWLLEAGSWQFGLAVAVYLIWLVLQEQFFAPFDQYMTVRIISTLATGGGFWWLMQQRWHLPQTTLAAMMVGLLVALCVSFLYMLLLRREHIVARANARDVRYDGLTDAVNWLSFRETLGTAFATAPQALSLVAIEIDDFHLLSTRFGHSVGNQVLIAFVDTLKAALEVIAPDSTLARTDGSVFMVILPKAEPAAALAVARACQERIHALVVPLEDGTAVNITASIGVGTVEPEDTTTRTLYRRVDAALRAAKTAGRDRIVSASAVQ